MLKQQTDSGAHVDQLSGQIQSLNDSLDEIKARIAKMSKQLEDMQAAQQTLTTPQASEPPTGRRRCRRRHRTCSINNALSDYNGGKNDLATQEFGQYVKTYPDTDLAGNAYFYLAEIAYRQGNYQEAAKDYDQVVQNFPSGNKAASAQLKKGFSLIELGQKRNGISRITLCDSALSEIE